MRFISPRAIVTAIVLVYLALAAAYAITIPKWNAPDEPSHYNYVKNIAQHGQLPVLRVGDYNFENLEKLKAARFPDSMPVDGVRYESHQPPLYYLLATPLFWATAALPVSSQVIALRLFSALFGALTVIVAYLTLRRVFLADAVIPLAVAAFVASVPMFIAITAAINNDSLAIFLLSLAVMAGISVSEGGQFPLASTKGEDKMGEGSFPPRLIRNLARKEHIFLGTLLGLILLTKTTAYIAVFVIAFAVIVHELRSGSSNPLQRVLCRLASIYAVALAISAWWFVRNAWVYGDLDIFASKRHDLVVIGQPLTGPLDLLAARHFVTVSFNSFWAQFGWMGILVDQRIYTFLWALCALAGLGLLLLLARVARDGSMIPPHQKWSLALLALSLALLGAGVIQYNLVYIQAQGRYFFPAIVAIGTFFVLGLREWVAERYTGPVLALVFLGLFVLDAVALVRFILPSLSS